MPETNGTHAPLRITSIRQATLLDFHTSRMKDQLEQARERGDTSIDLNKLERMLGPLFQLVDAEIRPAVTTAQVINPLSSSSSRLQLFDRNCKHHAKLVTRNHSATQLDEAREVFRRLVVRGVSPRDTQFYDDKALHDINQVIRIAGLDAPITEMHVDQHGDVKLFLGSEEKANLLREKRDLWLEQAFESDEATLQTNTFGVVCYKMPTSQMYRLGRTEERQAAIRQIYTENADRLLLSKPDDIINIRRLSQDAFHRSEVNVVLEFAKPETANRAIHAGIVFKNDHLECKALDSLDVHFQCTQCFDFYVRADKRSHVRRCLRCGDPDHPYYSGCPFQYEVKLQDYDGLPAQSTRKTLQRLDVLRQARAYRASNVLYFAVPGQTEFPYPDFEAKNPSQESDLQLVCPSPPAQRPAANATLSSQTSKSIRPSIAADIYDLTHEETSPNDGTAESPLEETFYAPCDEDQSVFDPELPSVRFKRKIDLDPEVEEQALRALDMAHQYLKKMRFE